MGSNFRDMTVFDYKVLLDVVYLIPARLLISIIDSDYKDTDASDVADHMGKSVKRVQSALKTLENNGWLLCDKYQDGSKKIELTAKSDEVFDDWPLCDLSLKSENKSVIDDYARRKGITVCDVLIKIMEVEREEIEF